MAPSARDAETASPPTPSSGGHRTTSTTWTASRASSAAGSSTRGTSFISWRTGSCSASQTTTRPNRKVSPLLPLLLPLPLLLHLPLLFPPFIPPEKSAHTAQVDGSYTTKQSTVDTFVGAPVINSDV